MENKRNNWKNKQLHRHIKTLTKDHRHQMGHYFNMYESGIQNKNKNDMAVSRVNIDCAANICRGSSKGLLANPENGKRKTRDCRP